MTVKIDAKVLGIKKPIEVNETNKVMKKTLKVQIEQEKLTQIDTDDKTDAELYMLFLENQLASQDLELDYLTTVLHLTSAQQEKLEDLSTDETDDLFGQVLQKVMHIDVDTKSDGDDEDEDATPSNTAGDAE